MLLLATMKLSAWTRLRILVTYFGYAIVIMVIPIVRGPTQSPAACVAL